MLSKKIVLITGISKGIGKACMETCLNKNAFVIGVTRAKINTKMYKIKKNKNLKIIYGDITNKSTIKKILSYQKKKNFLLIVLLIMLVLGLEKIL